MCLKLPNGETHFYCQAWEVFAITGTRALQRGLVSTIKCIALVIVIREPRGG